MAFARFAFTFLLIVASLISCSSEQLTANPTSVQCSDYCNAYGFWEAGPSCSDYCCGDLNRRFCCKNSSLDVSDIYPDVDYCYCPTSGCSSNDAAIPIWEALLYFLVPVAFFIIITVCFCQFGYRIKNGCSRCCRKTTDNAIPDNGIGSIDSTATLADDVNRNASQHLDRDFTYQMEPPSYETVTQDLPKYEDIVDATRGYDGPFEFTESTQDISAPPAEYEAVDSPSSESLNNDVPPPSYTPTMLEEA